MKNSISIAKTFKFEAAHKLSHSYTPKCQNIHGHSYKVEVQLSGLRLNEEAVLVDFTAVKEIFSPLIELFDHSLMIHRDDLTAASLNKICSEAQPPCRLIVFEINPTAEAMASYFVRRLHRRKSLLKCDYIFIRVKVWETETSWAEANSNEMLPPFEVVFRNYTAEALSKGLRD